MTIWGVAFSFDPRDWKLGRYDLMDASGRRVGEWIVFGCFAITREWI